MIGRDSFSGQPSRLPAEKFIRSLCLMAPSRGKFISVLIFEWTHARIRRSFFQFRFVFMTLLLCLTYFSIEIQFWKYIQPVVESTYYLVIILIPCIMAKKCLIWIYQTNLSQLFQYRVKSKFFH